MRESDHLELRNLYARFCLSLDDVDEEALATCFTTDAVLTVVERNPAVAAPGEPRVVSGRDAIVEGMLSAMRARPGYRHWTTNLHLAEVDDGRARGRVEFQIVTERGVTDSFGRDDDELVRDEATGLWQLASRQVTYLFRSTW